MTTEEKLIKAKKLADAMYYAAQYLGPVGSGERLHKAMDDYHQFIINEYHKEEPVSEDLDIAIGEYCSNPNNFVNWIGNHGETDDIQYIVKAIKFGANWQIKQLKRGVFIPGAKSVEFKLGEDYHISTKDFDRGKAKAYGAKEGDKIIAYFFVMDSGI